MTSRENQELLSLAISRIGWLYEMPETRQQEAAHAMKRLKVLSLRTTFEDLKAVSSSLLFFCNFENKAYVKRNKTKYEKLCRDSALLIPSDFV